MRRQNKFYTLVASQLMYDTMDQIDDSRYPTSRINYSISKTLFTVGLLLFMGAPVNYLILGNAEQTMILTAYSFFFFLGSGLVGLCSFEEH